MKDWIKRGMSETIELTQDAWVSIMDGSVGDDLGKIQGGLYDFGDH